MIGNIKQGKIGTMKHKKDQLDLFDEPADWQKEWKDMPEFIQKSRESIAHVVIHFETMEDMKTFSQLIGFPITRMTRGIFYPVTKRDTNYIYADEQGI